MIWFLALQGLVIVALGIWGVATAVVPLASGLVLVAFGLAWVAVWVVVIRFQHKSAALRDALAAVDPESNRQNRRQKQLQRFEWGLFAASLVWIAATVRMARPNELWPLYGAGLLLATMFGVMLCRLFIISNLDAAAGATLGASLGGGSKKRLLGKSGAGALSVVLIIVVVAGVVADQYADLPFKFMSLLWYALGLTMIWAVGAILWRWLRRARK